MSRAFDFYYRKEVNDSYAKNAQRHGTGPVQERKTPRGKLTLPKKKAEQLTEAGPMDAPPGPPMGGPEGGMGGPPMPGGGPPPPPANSVAKSLTAILMDAKNWMEEQKVKMGDLPPDAPEMATVHSAIGMVSEYMPQPGEDNNSVADKVSLLSQQLGQLFPDGGDGEVADYIRALSAKLAEFRATIDVAAPPEPAPAPAAPAAPKAAPKPPPEKPTNPDHLAKGLEIAAGVT